MNFPTNNPIHTSVEGPAFELHTPSHPRESKAMLASTTSLAGKRFLTQHKHKQALDSLAGPSSMFQVSVWDPLRPLQRNTPAFHFFVSAAIV